MIVGALRFSQSCAPYFWRYRDERYQKLLDFVPDSAKIVTGRLRWSSPSFDTYCAASYLNVSEIGVAAPIFYAVDEAGAAIDVARQMTDFARGYLCEFININVTERPVPYEDRHTRLTTPLVKGMLTVWLRSYIGKIEAPLDETGRVKICLCLGVDLDAENGQGIYLVTDKEVKLTAEQKKLTRNLRRRLKTFGERMG